MNNYYNLFLDDLRMPKNVTWINLPNHEWTIVRSYKEFRDIIWNKGIPNFVTYDHDLSDDHYGHGLRGDEIPYDSYTEKTGYDFCKFLCNECFKLDKNHPSFTVHSMNPVGKKNIEQYIGKYNEYIKDLG